MTYETTGTLTTDVRSGPEIEWVTQSDWEAAQSSENIEIVEGSFQLAEVAGLSRAQMLSRRPNGIAATVIEADTGTTARTAQALARRTHGNQLEN